MMAPLLGVFSTTPLWRIATPGAGAIHTINGGQWLAVEQKAYFFVMDLPHSDSCFVRAYPAATAEACPLGDCPQAPAG